MLALEASIVGVALVVAFLLRPWRLLANAPLLTPMLAALVAMPWIWALPALHRTPLQLQWSGACLLLLCLGWPLAVATLASIALLAALLTPVTAPDAIGMAAWLGVVPATLALAVGAAIRRFIGTHLFVYLLGRAFIGTALCVFAAGALSQWAGHVLPGIGSESSLVAHWLMAWGDAFITGMLATMFVAFKPQWLATWSDALYFPKP